MLPNKLQRKILEEKEEISIAKEEEKEVSVCVIWNDAKNKWGTTRKTAAVNTAGKSCGGTSGPWSSVALQHIWNT